MAAQALPAAMAEEQPLWEVGAGLAGFSFPAYRGSEQSQSLVIPAPYLVYRGKFIKADRDGLRAELFDSDIAELTVSAALSPPASSRKIDVRAGMPDLRANFEFGPQMNLKLWQSSGKAHQLKLLLPLRAAYTLERSPKSVGIVFHPKLNLDLRDVPGLPGWNVGLQAGALFGDRKQHQYFYGVDPVYSTAARPAFNAKSGFAGMQYLVGVSRRYDNFWVGAFLRHDSLRGTSFEASPLVRTRSNFSGGLAVSWIFGKSSERVWVDE